MKTITQNQENMKENKKHILMTQTMPDMSFGSIFIVIAHPSLLCAFKT